MYPVLDLLETIPGRRVTCRAKEDNQTTIKIFKKGYSAKLAGVNRTHKINLGTVFEAVRDQGIPLEYVESPKQCADIFTKDLPPAKWDNALELLGIEQRPPDDDKPDKNSKKPKQAAQAKAAPAQAVEEQVQGGEVADEITRPTQVGAAAKTLVRGAMAACAIIDDVCQAAKDEDDNFDQAENVRVCAMAAKTAHKRGQIERKKRPSGKLRGWRKLIEV